MGPNRGGSAPLAWSSILYLLLVFVLPLAVVNHANAQEDAQDPLREDLGTVIGIDLGTTYSYVLYDLCIEETTTEKLFH